MEGERADRDAAARDYEKWLPDPIDLVLLGIGDDAHTASLFPGSPALDERARRVVPSEGPKPPIHRLTITPPVIEKARDVLMLVAGASKAAAVKRALEGPWDPKQVPSQLARRGTWIIDPAAG
jgi:6-phosphogluconolactonase